MAERTYQVATLTSAALIGLASPLAFEIAQSTEAYAAGEDPVQIIPSMSGSDLVNVARRTGDRMWITEDVPHGDKAREILGSDAVGENDSPEVIIDAVQVDASLNEEQRLITAHQLGRQVFQGHPGVLEVLVIPIIETQPEPAPEVTPPATIDPQILEGAHAVIVAAQEVAENIRTEEAVRGAKKLASRTRILAGLQEIRPDLSPDEFAKIGEAYIEVWEAIALLPPEEQAKVLAYWELAGK